MLWTIFVVLLILWLLGFSLHIAGGLIHLLLVVALVILVINLVSGEASRKNRCNKTVAIRPPPTHRLISCDQLRERAPAMLNAIPPAISTTLMIGETRSL
jgi:Family of unknown function (DUF5670)